MLGVPYRYVNWCFSNDKTFVLFVLIPSQKIFNTHTLLEPC